jgi:hypothetical protein
MPGKGAESGVELDFVGYPVMTRHSPQSLSSTTSLVIPAKSSRGFPQRLDREKGIVANDAVQLAEQSCDLFVG